MTPADLEAFQNGVEKMTTPTWHWLVSRGATRESVCLERDSERAIKRFKNKHSNYETITRAAGYHWDGGKL